ncbi:TonB-dependent receptor [Myxococcota bacterium]|nr:TonB-dependent receptor [Myxococcota bacterium]MBU1382748.1 TonB-dependent receptor [Myxococcota bacterium]MBU1498490.1 TonB-dependent receptor [Myxococcota bacterium]
MNILAFFVIFNLSSAQTVPPAKPGTEVSSTQTSGKTEKKSDVTKPNSKNDEEIVVTARRQKEKPFESNRNISILSQKKLSELNPRTVPEALLELPGVFLQKTNHGGGAPIIRGMIGPRILIMYDGVRINNSVFRTGPLQYLNLFDQSSLHNLEVLKGAGSVLYGSDAMGGVVHSIPIGFSLINETKGFTYQGTLSSRFQSTDNGQMLNGNFIAGQNGVGILGAFSFRNFENLRGGGDIGEQIYTSYRQQNALLSGLYTINSGLFAGTYIKVSYLYSNMDDAGRTDKLESKHQVTWYDNTYQMAWAAVYVPFKPLNTTLDGIFTYQKFFERKRDNNLADDDIAIRNSTVDETDVSTFGVDLKLNTSLFSKKLRVRYGGLFYRDTVNADRKTVDFETDGIWTSSTVGVYPDSSTYSQGGGFLLSEFDLLRKLNGSRLEVSAGARFSSVSAHAPSRETLPAVDFSTSGMTYFASLQYIHHRKINVSAVFSQGMRAPNLQEAVFLGDAGKNFEIPGTALKPEYSNNLELLVKGNFRKLQFSISGWYSKITDVIGRRPGIWEGQTEIGGDAVMESYNGTWGKLFGTSASARFLPGLGFELNAHINWVRGEQADGDGNTTPMTRIPPLFAHMGLGWNYKLDADRRGFVEVFGRYASKQDRLSPEDESDVRIPDGGTPSWYTLNARAMMGFRNVSGAISNLRVGLSLENVLNKKYKYHGSGLYNAGRNFMLFFEAVF